MTLEQEATELITTYLWTDTKRWVFGDGCSSSDYHREQAAMRRLNEIAVVLGEGRVRAIWSETRAVIRAMMAEDAGRVLATDVIKKWLADDAPDDPSPEEIDKCLADFLGGTLKPPDGPDEQVRIALNNIWRVRLRSP
jgi:hypothetical protein